MAKGLPESANLDWLKKTAKQRLRAWKTQGRLAKLADAQLALAREYGFSSWRTLKSALDAQRGGAPDAPDHSTAEATAAFLRLVGQGKIEDVRTMLEASPPLVNAVGQHPFWGGQPQALHVSIETRRRDMFDLLLDAGADVNGDNARYEHWSPLMLAASRGRREMAAALIERGAGIGLLEALLLADDETVGRMLREGAAALPESRPSGSLLALARTPFAIDRLLDLGVSTEGTDTWGASAIEALSRLGPKGRPLVRQMIGRGIEAEPQEYARLGDMETLAALCRSRPEIARADAVMMGAVDFGHHDLVAWLLDRGASANARTTAGARNTALHSAAWNGDLRMVEILVANGADLSACDEQYKTTPLTWAQVSIEVSNNPKCAEIAAYLESKAAMPPG